MAKNAGKAPSIQLYYKDLLADIQEHPNDIVGAWIKILCHIWHNQNTGQVTKTNNQWRRILGVDEKGLNEILRYINEKNIGVVTKDNKGITVLNRRSAREAKLREQNRLRQQKYRDRHQDNGAVAQMKSNPSSSTSSSISSSTSIKDSNSSSNKKHLGRGFPATSAAALKITSIEADKLISFWNKISSKQVIALPEHLTIQKLLSETLQAQLGLTFDDIYKAAENYSKALKVKGTRAHAWNLHNFLLQIQRGKKTYLPGFFDIDHFKPETIAGKMPGQEEGLTEAKARELTGQE
jgi:hypothetical protein